MSQDNEFSQHFYQATEKELRSIEDYYKKSYEQTVKVVMQFNVLFLSGWAALASTERLYKPLSKWVYVSISLHVSSIVLLAAIIFIEFRISRRALFEFSKYAEAISNFRLSVLRAIQDKRNSENESSPREQVVHSLLDWQDSQQELFKKSEVLLIFASLTNFILIIGIIISTITIFYNLKT